MAHEPWVPAVGLPTPRLEGPSLPLSASSPGRTPGQRRTHPIAMGMLTSPKGANNVSISQGVIDSCKALGYQSGPVDLVLALQQYLAQPGLVHRWLAGEAVFNDI